jgi:hypothetical protein
MTNFKCAQSDREQFRTDFDNQFLLDYINCFLFGKDPCNHIGLQCGINNPRTLQVAQEKALAGEL